MSKTINKNETINANEETKTCCICGCKFTGFGNNPEGAAWLTHSGTIEFYEGSDKEARCCDACNSAYVLPGRIYSMTHSKTETFGASNTDHK